MPQPTRPHRPSPDRPAWLAALATALVVWSVGPAALAAPPADDPPPPARSAEPNVQRTVTEDEGSRIDELKVRGNTTRITVKPKVGTTKGYEILTDDGSRDLSDGLTGSRGAAGKRVWNVLSF